MQDLRDQLQASLGGSYTVERPLSGGGMARVYLAEEIALRRKVVIKLLPPDLAGAVSVERFKREMQVAGRLQHPLIVPVLSAGEAAGLLYFTMPYVEGESLDRRLSRDRNVSIDEAVRILRDVLEALSFAHEQGVVHRDIKPANLLLRSGHTLLTDFGIAKALSARTPHSDTADGTVLTQVGVSIGTPAYMAPEQGAGDPDADHRADIYAVGVVAYELFAGDLPFHGRSMSDMFAAHASKTPVPVDQRRPDVPPAIVALVMRCLEKDPANRPQSADEALYVLSTYTAERPLPTRRRGVARWAAAAIAALVVAAVGYAGWRARPASDAIAPVTLAVLPFHALTNADSGSFLGVGIPDAIITRLAGLHQVRVRSTSAILPFERGSFDPQDAGRTLGVDYVLTGTLELASEGLTARVQMVRVRDGEPLWGAKYSLPRMNLLGLQDSVADRVVSELKIRVSDDERARVYRRYTSDPAAYESYVRGRALLVRHTKEATLAAIQSFEDALSRDKGYALARAGLAAADAEMHLRFAKGDEVKTWRDRAIAEANASLRLDSNLAETHQALAAVYGRTDFDWPLTITESAKRSS